MTPYDGYIMTLIPCANYLAIFLFYLIWKGHYFGELKEVEDDNSTVKPEKFCLEIEGLEDTYVNE